MDILKGIGIISIVIGHSAPVLIPAIEFSSKTFVYGYHIMIFMFVLGFLFRKDKNVPPAPYIGKTILSQSKLYISYTVIFILLHNLLVGWGFFPGTVLTLDEMGTAMLSSMVFTWEEPLLGALWFVPMYMFAAILFSVLFSTAERMRRPIVWHIVFLLLSGFVGVMMHSGTPWYLYHIQTSVLSLPVCYLGYFAKQHWEKLKKFVTWYGTVAAAVALHFLLTTKYGGIELAANEIVSPLLFYPVTLVGIYFCLGLARILSAWRVSRLCVATVGKNSFHIMALHFAAIKLVDVLYGISIGAEMSVYSVFPFAFDLPYLYYPVGVLLPLAVIALCKLGKRYARMGIERLCCAFASKDSSPNE